MKERFYSLGTSEDEQARLHLQRELYGDTANLRFSPTDTVCEIGSGAGANLWIAERVSRGRYIGIDAELRQNKTAAAYVRKLGLTNVELRTASGEHTGLPSSSVDVAFCRCVLSHQPDPLPLINEMYRITKRGGRLLVVEPHNASYFCGPAKPHLMKCFRARTHYAYGDGKGSPDAALNLYPLFKKRGLNDVRITPLVITVFGDEPKRCSKFLENWLRIVATVAEALLKIGAVTQQDLDLAEREAQEITSETFVYQSMWIAEGVK